ncbi:MAG: hypothetical protein KDL87_15705, partial [Verrucomicrobiae bacterium]|nr:hypothetical protein [Verrucomicrobiae bacterium]
LSVAAWGEEFATRVWTSRDGRVLVGSLLRSDGTSVTLKMVDGREVAVPVENLSEADRAYLAAPVAGTGAPARKATMPSSTSIDPNVPVSGGPTTFETARFTFESENALTREFVSEASRIFESTLEAVGALPLGIVPRPAEGETKFRARFMGRDTFEKEYAARPSQDAVRMSVRNVGGVYIPARREVLVPFTSLGMTASASYVTLRGNGDMSTLIHEITHQVMHDWLAMMPVWVSEGLAEYLSAVPYQNGRFDFKFAADGLKKSLLEKHGIGAGQTVTMPSPSSMIEAGSAGWRGGSDDYLSAKMLMYYFIHLDQPDQPCATMAAYLKELDQSRRSTEQFIADYNSAVRTYEAERLAYNKAIEAFNASVTKFRAEVDAYNDRVKQFNAQAQARVPLAQRVKVGDQPVPPVPPEQLKVPEILKEAPNEGKAIDIPALVQAKAKPQLYRHRDAAALEAALQSAFAGMGITVSYSSSGGTGAFGQ